MKSRPMSLPTHEHWMRLALERADVAAQAAEVPVGALVVRDGQILGEGWNLTEKRHDATAHAEMLAIRQALSATGSRRLEEATLYVTLEPCAMCAGAIVLTRLAGVVFGAYDPKGGACGTLRNIVQDPRLNHGCDVIGGVLEGESAARLQRFFADLRASLSSAD